MSLADSKFQIKAPYIFTGEELALIEDFKQLPPEEMAKFWANTNEGEWGKLKKNLKVHYIRVQDYQCPYCLQRIEVDHNGIWDAEHIIPKKTHPHFTFESQNLCVSCKDCNGAKDDKQISYARVKEVFSTDKEDYFICHPHFDEYSEHIRVISIAGFYMPRTSKGKTLIEICGLLRFLYKYSGYECDVVEVQKRSVELTRLLQEASDSAELGYVFDCLEELAKEGKRLLRERRMASACL